MTTESKIHTVILCEVNKISKSGLLFTESVVTELSKQLEVALPLVGSTTPDLSNKTMKQSIPIIQKVVDPTHTIVASRYLDGKLIADIKLTPRGEELFMTYPKDVSVPSFGYRMFCRNYPMNDPLYPTAKMKTFTRGLELVTWDILSPDNI